MDTFKKVVEKYPDEPEGWWGVFRCAIFLHTTWDKTKDKYSVWRKLLEYDDGYAQTAMKLHDYSREYERLWGELENKYARGFEYEEDARTAVKKLKYMDVQLLLYKFENSHLQKLQKIALSTFCREVEAGKISCFQFYLWWNDGDGRDVLYKTFKKVIKKRREIEQAGKTRKIGDGSYLYDGLDYDRKKNTSMESCLEIEKLLQRGEIFDYDDDKALKPTESSRWMKPYVLSVDKYIPTEKFYEIYGSYIFQLGNTIILEKCYNDSHMKSYYYYYTVILNEKISPNEIREHVYKSMKRCTSCGGKIIGGFFSEKRCKKCGKKY